MKGSSALRRIKADIRELSIDPSDQYHAAPLEHDMFEWHFTIRGAPGTDFAGGVYHGRILLPPEYPFKPPNIVFLTPSGRFECGVKVCLSFSAHHPELWQPAWGIRLILEALISFLPTPADGALGALNWTPAERRKLARESVKFRCAQCCDEGQTCADLLPSLRAQGSVDDGGGATKKMMFHKQIEELKMLQFQNHVEIEQKQVEGSPTKADATESESAKRAEDMGGTEDNRTAEVAPKPPPTEVASSMPPSVLPRETEPEPTENKTDQLLQAAAPSPPSVTPHGAPEQRANDKDTATKPSDDVSGPPPIPEGGTQITHDTTTTTTPDNAANENVMLVSDRLLNVMLGFFSVIVLVLIRQAHSLVDELNEMGVQVPAPPFP